MMYKLFSLSLVLSMFCFASCSKSQVKTRITVQLSETDFIYSLSNDSKDSVFLSVFKAAKAAHDPTKGDFVDLFAKSLMKTSSEYQLASIFATFELKDKINYNSSNDEVIKVLKDEVKAAEMKTMQVLKKRMETANTGTSFLSKLADHPVVDIQESSQKHVYTININKKVNKEHMKSFLQRHADLGFWETYGLSEIWDKLKLADDTLKTIFGSNRPDLRKKIGVRFDSIDKDYPLFSLLRPSVSNEGVALMGNEVGTCLISDTSLVNSILDLPEIKNLFPRNLKLLWEIKPNKYDKIYMKLYAIKVSNRDGLPILSGGAILEATAEESSNTPVVRLKFNDEGTKIWSRLSRDNIGKQIAMVVNQKVFSSPTVMSQIDGGAADIAGNFTIDEVNDLASLLNAGVMPKIKVKVMDVKEVE